MAELEAGVVPSLRTPEPVPARISIFPAAPGGCGIHRTYQGARARADAAILFSYSTAFHVTRERPQNEKEVIRAAGAALRERLRADWVLRRDTVDRQTGFDARLTLEPPVGDAASLLVDVKMRAGPRDVGRLLERWGDPVAHEVPVLAAPYLSPRTRELLEAAGISYVDSTGNVWLSIPDPTVFIRTQGADTDPWPQDAKLRSLKGAAAARVVRALLDFKPPYGISELAARAGSPLATVHRVVDLLDREGLLERRRRGPVTRVDWEGVLARWATEYDLFASNRVATYVEPRGLDRLLERLRINEFDYAVTGSLAAARLAPVAPSRLAMVFVDGPAEDAAERVGLRAADEGANVFLLEPFDAVALERGSEEDGIRYAATSQVAADLAQGPGRGPSESEALVHWMAEHEDAWRT